MENSIPYSVPKLISTLERALPGVVKYEAPLGVAAGFATAMTNVLADLKLSDNKYKQCVDDLKARRITADSLLDTGRSFVFLVHQLLKPRLGHKYSLEWRTVGFEGSLMTPNTIDRMLRTLSGIESYLTLHPEFENNDANITALRSKQLHDNLRDARTAVDEFSAKCDRLSKERALNGKIARRRMRRVVNDAETAFDPLDERFVELGLNKPGAVAIPDVPTNIIAVLIGPGAVALKWDAAPRAAHYRIWKKVVGVDTEFIAVGSRQDLDFALEGLPLNSQVQIAVSAVSSGGESAKSEAVTVQLV